MRIRVFAIAKLLWERKRERDEARVWWGEELFTMGDTSFDWTISYVSNIYWLFASYSAVEAIFTVWTEDARLVDLTLDLDKSTAL